MECRALELLKLERVNSARIAVREGGGSFFNRVGMCSARVITLVIGIKAGSQDIKAAFYMNCIRQLISFFRNIPGWCRGGKARRVHS